MTQRGGKEMEVVQERKTASYRHNIINAASNVNWQTKLRELASVEKVSGVEAVNRQEDSQSYRGFQTINIRPKRRRDLQIKTKDRLYRKVFRTLQRGQEKRNGTFVCNVYITGIDLLIVAPGCNLYHNTIQPLPFPTLSAVISRSIIFFFFFNTLYISAA